MKPPPPFLDESQALACIHCGLCLGSCPTYLETGNENESPRGRIYLMRALQAGRLELTPETARHIDLCLGCRACEAACPSGVQYGALLETTRAHVETHLRRHWLDRWLRRVAIERVFPFPRRMKLALAGARLARLPLVTALLPARLREMLQLLPEQTQTSALPEFIPAETEPRRGRAALVTGCVMSVMFGQTHAATARLLGRFGWEVAAPRDQTCCGALYAHGGNLEAARASARRNIAVFERINPDLIIINAAGCGSTLKEYGHLLEGDPAWRERALRFSNKVRDLAEVLQPEGFLAAQWAGEKVTWHDACHLAHAQRLSAGPRALVQHVAGERFIELPEADVCCGSAGSYNLTEPDMARRLQRRKVQHILETGAGVVVTSNPGCILQMQAGLKQAGAPVQVMHIADFLVQALPKK